MPLVLTPDGLEFFYMLLDESEYHGWFIFRESDEAKISCPGGFLMAFNEMEKTITCLNDNMFRVEGREGNFNFSSFGCNKVRLHWITYLVRCIICPFLAP